MLLALDVGNTHVVVGLMEGREVRRSFRIATRRDSAVGDYAVALSQLLELAEVDRRDVEQVIISSVVPPVTRALQGAARLLTVKEPLVVGGNVRCRVPVMIKHPETLGADLLTAAVGALDLYRPPLLLIDMGTATTISVLDAQGAFRGGAILPGANLALSAQPTGGEKTVWNLSLRQRFALPPPSQREARGIHIPLRGGTHGSRPTASDICDRAGSLTD